jgi:hypothetical protein
MIWILCDHLMYWNFDYGTLEVNSKNKNAPKKKLVKLLKVWAHLM